jgi:antitoxin ParD1/3/4
MPTATMNISLPASMKDFVDVQLEAGGYGSTSEYVRELIRRDQQVKAEAALKGLLLAGLNSGPGVRADTAFFKNLRARIKRGAGSAKV